MMIVSEKIFKYLKSGDIEKAIELCNTKDFNPNIEIGGFEIEGLCSIFKDIINVTPLHIAVYLGQVELVKALFIKKINLDTNLIDIEGNAIKTPLSIYTERHFLLNKKQVECVAEIVKHGGNINDKNNQGLNLCQKFFEFYEKWSETSCISHIFGYGETDISLLKLFVQNNVDLEQYKASYPKAFEYLKNDFISGMGQFYKYLKQPDNYQANKNENNLSLIINGWKKRTSESFINVEKERSI